MASLSDRTLGLAARVNERPREVQQVSLVLIDGTELRGMLHRTQGTRTLDYLNFQSEGFVALTDAVRLRQGQTETIGFIALNKAHIICVVEASETD